MMSSGAVTVRFDLVTSDHAGRQARERQLTDALHELVAEFGDIVTDATVTVESKHIDPWAPWEAPEERR